MSWRCGDCGGRGISNLDDECPDCVRRLLQISMKDTNPKDSAASTRLDLSLVPDSVTMFTALGLTEGDLKYGGYNWRVAGVRVSVYVAAIRRHLAKFVDGEWADPKTGVPHLASSSAGLAVLIDAMVQGNANDDRPPRQDTGELFDEMEERVKQLHTVFPPSKSPGRYTEKKHGAGK